MDCNYPPTSHREDAEAVSQASMNKLCGICSQAARQKHVHGGVPQFEGYAGGRKVSSFADANEERVESLLDHLAGN